MASCFAGLVRGGAFWCQGYRAIRSWTLHVTYEHAESVSSRSVQCVVEISVVRLVIVSGGKRMIYGNGGFQRLQHIAKLNGRSLPAAAGQW